MRDSKKFKQRFKLWKDGKQVYENGRALPVFEDDETSYKEIMKDVARENYRQWGYNNPADAWQDQLNNPTYNYRGYYTDPKFYGAQSGSFSNHWPDTYKTPLHETFSDESLYHGKKSETNPSGLRGGLWIGDKFIPAAWQSRIQRYKNGKLPKFGDGENLEVEKYINATTDENNGGYWQQSPFNNPVIQFIDPSGITSYPQVKEAFDKGNTYDKVIGILGAIPAVGKVLRPVSKFGSVVNAPSDTKSFLDWNDYYKSIVYKDNRSGRIGLRGNIGSYDNDDFARDVSSGNIRRATPDEIKWWYVYNTNGHLDPSPGLPLGSVIGKTLKQRKQHRQ